MNYIIISFICVISLIIAIFNIHESELLMANRKKPLIELASIIILNIVIDAFTIFINGKGHSNILTLLKILEFCITPLVPIMFSYIIANSLFWKKIYKCFIVLVVINCFLQVSTLFHSVPSYINEGGYYNRTIFGIAYVAIVGICFIMFIICAENSFAQNTTNINGTLYSIGIFLAIGLYIRSNYEMSNSDWLCITFSFFIFVVYFCNIYFKIDAVTHLLNRNAFNAKLTQINYSTALILIDANKFKEANDIYGHSNGDIALYKISDIIFKTFYKIGYCYRIGGDEFCIILKPKQLIKLQKGHENIEVLFSKIIKNMDSEIEKASKNCPMLANGVSAGYSIYYSSFDHPNMNSFKNIEEVLLEADLNMYSNKKG